MTKNVTVRHRNLQTQRTRADFFTALCELLTTEELSNLTIKDLCDRAGYSRRTFYRHFDSPVDILQQHLNKLIFSLFNSLRPVNQEQINFQQTVESFFSFWSQHLSLLELLNKQNLLYLLPQTATRNINNSFLADTLSKQPDAQFVQNFGISGMFALLETWLNTQSKHSPQEMGQIATIIQHRLQI